MTRPRVVGYLVLIRNPGQTDHADWRDDWDDRILATYGEAEGEAREATMRGYDAQPVKILAAGKPLLAIPRVVS